MLHGNGESKYRPVTLPQTLLPLSLREGEILGLQPGDLDFDAADGRGAITVNKAMQRANKEALSKIDPSQIYHSAVAVWR